MSDERPFHPSGPIDPVAAQLIAYFGTEPMWQGMATNPAVETRAAIKAATPVPRLPAVDHVEDFRVAVDGGDILVRLYRPVANPAAVIIWAHGGGFTLGSVDEYDTFTRTLALRTGCAVASVEYRLAPEHKFPVPVDDMLAATRWVLENVEKLANARVPVFVGGDSAGANLSTVVTRKLHATQGGMVAGNILVYPCTDNKDAASLRRFESPFMGVDIISFFLDQYVVDPAAQTHPDFAPIYATGLDGLPPTIMITAEHDVITEQAEDYGNMLADAGVDVRFHRYPGMIHGFLVMDIFFDGAAGAAMGEISDFVKHVGG